MKRHVTACWAPELPGKELCAFMDVCMCGYVYVCVYMYVQTKSKQMFLFQNAYFVKIITRGIRSLLKSVVKVTFIFNFFKKQILFFIVAD